VTVNTRPLARSGGAAFRFADVHETGGGDLFQAGFRFSSESHGRIIQEIDY
jgi:hypothetical protein